MNRIKLAENFTEDPTEGHGRSRSMLKSEITGKIKVWVNEYNGNTYYQTSLSKKKYANGQYTGEFEYGNIPLKFKSGVSFTNGEQIELKNAWLSFYKTRDNKTVPQIVVTEFDRVGGEQLDDFSAVDEVVPF